MEAKRESRARPGVVRKPVDSRFRGNDGEEGGNDGEEGGNDGEEDGNDGGTTGIMEAKRELKPTNPLSLYGRGLG